MKKELGKKFDFEKFVDKLTPFVKLLSSLIDILSR